MLDCVEITLTVQPMMAAAIAVRRRIRKISLDFFSAFCFFFFAIVNFHLLTVFLLLLYNTFRMTIKGKCKKK